MWTREALNEALGKPDRETYTQSGVNPGRQLPILLWHCDGGEIIATSDLDGFFHVDVSCPDDRHRAMARMSEARVRNVRIVDDATGEEQTQIPGALNGASLEFDLETPVTVHVHLTAWLDQDDKFRAAEEFDAGLYVAGSHRVRILLSIDPDGPGRHDGPAQWTVDLQVEILDPETAKRDWAAGGIALYHRRFAVGR